MNERELIQRCLEGIASPQEQALVRADPRLRRLLVEHHRLEIAIRAHLLDEAERQQRVAAILSDVRGRAAAETLAGIRREIGDTSPALRTAARVPLLRRAVWLIPLAAAALVLLAILAPWKTRSPAGPGRGGVPPIQAQSGGGQTRQPAMPAPAAPLRMVRTGEVLAPRSNETVVARLEDGSRIELHGPADLIVGRTLRLREGRLVVHAAKHAADDPLVVLAPHGRTEVVGTEFTIDANNADTRLAVAEGLVRFVPNGGTASLVGAGTSVAATVTARDPIHQPFASDSPWNTALGSGARYESIDGVPLAAGAHLETREWSVPIYVARPVDPVRRLMYRSLRTEAGRVRMDPAALLDVRDDTFLALVDERLEMVWEMYGCAIDSNGVLLSADITGVPLRGSGWGLEGVNHAGASILGGLVRKGELRRGAIPHALAVQVQASLVNKTSAPFEWPAHRALSSWHRYGTNGNVRLGSLLAIPPDVHLPALPLSPEGRTLARALQDYGAYVIGTFDRGQKPLVFVAETACGEDVSPRLLGDLDRITPLLRRVGNNDALHVGGGGTPRRPAPPPLVELAP